MILAATLKIALVAISLGLDVFAVSVGVGIRGTDRALKIRIGAAFATAEMAMTIVGVLLGNLAGRLLGDIAGYFGFAALAFVGIYMVYESVQHEASGGFDLSRGWGLLLGSLSISLDSLGIGFSIIYLGVPLGISIACIGVASIGATTLGLTLGSALGKRIEERAGLLAGIILIATGLGFAALKYWHVGL